MLTPNWTILGGRHSGKKLPECHKKQITITNPPHPLQTTVIKKKKRQTFPLMNMQIHHRGVSACLKNCCFCFQQLIVQTTALSLALSLSFSLSLSLSLSFCLSLSPSIRLSLSLCSMNMVSRLDPALSSPSSPDGWRLAMEMKKNT